MEPGLGEYWRIIQPHLFSRSYLPEAKDGHQLRHFEVHITMGLYYWTSVLVGVSMLRIVQVKLVLHDYLN